MTYQTAIEYAKLTCLPASHEAHWNAFLALPQATLWADDRLCEHRNLFAFSEELCEEIIRVKHRIEADEVLDTLARFCHWTLFVRVRPYLADKAGSLLPEILGEDKGLFGLVVLVEEALRTLSILPTLEGVDPDYITKNYTSLNNFAIEYKKEHGVWGINSFSWNCNCVTPYMNRCGHLAFEPVSIEYNYNVYIHKTSGDVLVLAGDGVNCTEDGLLISHGCPFPQAFSTTVQQNGNITIAHRIDPLGFVEREPSPHTLEEYDHVIKQWDTLLAFHIPAGPGYTVDATQEAFVKAIEFFNRVFPDIDIKGIWCYSWLFSPQLRLIMSEEESEMVRIQQRCYQVPAWRDSGAYNRFVFKVDGDLTKAELPQNSRLHRRLAAIIQRGGYPTSGGMFVPLSSIDNWSEMRYDDTDSLAVYAANQPHETADLRVL